MPACIRITIPKTKNIKQNTIMREALVKCCTVLLFVSLCSSLFAQKINIIPQPEIVVGKQGSFMLNNNTYIVFNASSLKRLADYTISSIQAISGNYLRAKQINGKQANAKAIYLAIDNSVNKGKEGYVMEITPDAISIKAASDKGLFYGVQSLLQLIPLDNSAQIPCVSIQDKPRFAWRGLMLDVSRHFFSITEVKRLIDEMAHFKFNILHLHLADDQGWRVEIKSLPELTRVGAWRVPRFGLWWEREPPKEGETATYGGFYTQQELKELVQYAAGKHIEILPEIDVPGHSLAAIASYPDLSSTKKIYKVNPGSKFYEIEDNALCPGQEATFEFLDKVFTEIATIFPFQYIHIGGDECYKGFWVKCDSCQKRKKDNNLKNEEELQSYLIKRLEVILKSKGKKLLGWDEILEGGLAPEATVMSWRGMKGGITAAQAKHHVIMSPFSSAYLDLYQGDPAIEPPTYSVLRLKDVYAFEPVPENVDSTYILGGQANLWTESVPTFHHAEYMFWPRSLAMAEVLWSPASAKNWSNFIERTEWQCKRFDKAGVNYALSFYDAIIIPSKSEENNLQVELDTELEGLDLYYTFDNTYPDKYASKYKSGEKLQIPPDADTFRVITFKNGKPVGRIITVVLTDLEKRISRE